jgi:hypothetical protein
MRREIRWPRGAGLGGAFASPLAKISQLYESIRKLSALGHRADRFADGLIVGGKGSRASAATSALTVTVGPATVGFAARVASFSHHWLHPAARRRGGKA